MMMCASAASRCFDRGDIDLAHLHHGVERTLGRRAVRIGDGGDQRAV
jgi:hypothetical protein